jgi:hypothetical protein
MTTIAVNYKQPLVVAVVLQVFFLALGVCVRDFGGFFSAVACSSVVFWAGVFFVFFRHPSDPSRSDLLYVRFGLIPIVIAGVVLLQPVLHRKHVSIRFSQPLAASRSAAADLS